MNMLNTFIKPMHREGIKFVIIFSFTSVILFFIYTPLGWVGIGLTIWCYYFFRDPIRTTPVRDGLLVSPADGVISLIEKTMPPPELDIKKEKLTRISVFMNVFNCHVNRSPFAGEAPHRSCYRGFLRICTSIDHCVLMMWCLSVFVP